MIYILERLISPYLCSFLFYSYVVVNLGQGLSDTYACQCIYLAYVSYLRINRVFASRIESYPRSNRTAALLVWSDSSTTFKLSTMALPSQLRCNSCYLDRDAISVFVFFYSEKESYNYFKTTTIWLIASN